MSPSAPKAKAAQETKKPAGGSSKHQGGPSQRRVPVPKEEGTPPKVLFKTRMGLHLQFDANPDLDQWLHLNVQRDEDTGEYVKHTGERLTEAEQVSYLQYQQIHESRCRLEDAADKLSRITDKYMPLIADESRVFVICFPEQAPRLLKRARKVRRKVKAKQKGGANNPQKGASGVGERRQREKKAAPKQLPKRGDTTRHVTKEATAQRSEQQPKKHKAGGRTPQVRQPPGEEQFEPDWGDDASQSSAVAEDAKKPQEPQTAAVDTTSWPWGEAGRPSDRGESHGILGQRPNEPATAPRWGTQHPPLRSAIQLVQAHMAKKRVEHRPPREEVNQ